MRYALIAPLLALSFTCLGTASARDLGQPVKAIKVWAKGLIDRPEGTRGYDLWATTYNRGGAEAFRYDPDTGAMKTWPLPGTTEIWPTLRGAGGHMYMGGQGSMLYRVNAATDDMDVLGPSPSSSFVRALALGSDGKIYGGSITNDLWRFDPASGEFEDLGDTGGGVSYVASMCGTSGRLVFCGLGMPARLVTYDINSGEKKQILAAEYFDDSFVYGMHGGRRWVCAYLWPSARLLIFEAATGELRRELIADEGQPPYTLAQVDRRERVWLRQEGVEHLTVYDPATDTLSQRHENSLPRLRPPISIDGKGFIKHGRFDGAVIREARAGVSAGTEGIFAMGVGPDGKVYSDGYQILDVCVTDPATGESSNLGPLDVGATGETYSFNADDRHLYIAKYTHGGVYRYDPAQPFTPTGKAPGSNPLLLGEMGMPCYRPQYNCWGPDGNLWFAGVAGWGWPGWGVGIVSPESGPIGDKHYPDRAFSGIASLPPERVAVAAGNALLIWNATTKEEESVVEMPAGPVATDADGTLWVASGANLRAFRWEDDLVEVGSWECSDGAIRELAEGRDGNVYGLAGEALIRVERGGGPPVKVTDCPASAAHLSPGLDNKFYYAIGANLHELAVE